MPYTIDKDRDQYGEQTITQSISERHKKKTDPEYNTDSYLRDQQALASARQAAKEVQALYVKSGEIPKEPSKEAGFTAGPLDPKKKKDSMSY